MRRYGLNEDESRDTFSVLRLQYDCGYIQTLHQRIECRQFGVHDLLARGELLIQFARELIKDVERLLCRLCVRAARNAAQGRNLIVELYRIVEGVLSAFDFHLN